MQGEDLGTPALNAVAADIKPRLAAYRTIKKASHETRAEGWSNTKGVAQDLVTRSALIRNKVGTKEIMICSALYSLGDGKVSME